MPCFPDGCNSWHEQNASECHSQTSPPSRIPAQCYCDKKIQRGIFQEVDAICEKRNRADGKRYTELDAEIGQVQNSDDDYYLAQICRHCGWFSIPHDSIGFWPFCRGTMREATQSEFRYNLNSYGLSS